MATQIIIAKRAKSRKRLAEQDKAGASTELPAFNNRKRQSAVNVRSNALYGSRTAAGLESDTSDGDFRYGKLGLEDGRDAMEDQDRTVISRIYDMVKETKDRKTEYCNLLSFLLFTSLYMIVLYMQQNSALVYQLTTANSALLPQDNNNNNLPSFTYPSDIYTYLNNTFIQTLWADPVCGDGVCDRPIEFNGFGRFGCTPDCGPMDTVPVTVQFMTDFQTAQDQGDSDWNVCMIYPDNLCWFDTNQKFADQAGTFQTTLNLPNGTWEIRLTAPANGVTGKATTQWTDALGSPADATLSSWGNCVADEDSDLIRCRSICSKSAGCAVDACANIEVEKMGGLYIDCVGLCNANFTSLDAYQNLTCLQIVSAANSTKKNSIFAASGRTCTLDPAYLTTHPEEAAAFSSPPARAPLPFNQSDVGARRRLSSAVPPARRHLSQALNGTQLYWDQFGKTDAQRFRNLATALSRAMYTWVIDTCLAKYPMTPPKTGPRMLGFFCAYFGGPATLDGCSYLDPASGQNLTSADIDGLHAVLLARYGPGSAYNISQPEQERFVSILKNALLDTIGSSLTDQEIISIGDHLHQTDAEIVAQENANTCNFVYVVLPWKLDVHHSSNLTVGDSIQFVWADDLPHAIKGKNQQDQADIFNGFGSGRRIISRGTLCTSENAGAGETGSFLADPVPCIVSSAGASSAGFSLTQVFTEPGVYEYVDAHFGASMTGTVYVSPLNSTSSSFVTMADKRECKPGCPLRFLGNGRCGVAFNCNTVECGFDGGDCACPDPATALTTSTGSSTNNLCRCPAGQIRGDSGTCCQAQSIGSDLHLPFDVVIVDKKESLFDPSNYTRTRYATNHNRIIGGLFLHQTRYGGEVCKEKRFLNLFQYCISGTSTEPFGVDPVFIPTSSLYNPDLVEAVGDYYTPAEITAQGTPLGFFSTKTEGGGEGYPLVFDINLDQMGATNRLQYLMDGLFLDNATDTLTLELVTYNGDSSQFVNNEITFTFQQAGKIAINHVINAVNVQPYRRPLDYVRACLEIVVAVCIFYGVYKEASEAVNFKRKRGSFLPYFQTAWNYIDLMSLTLLVTAVVMWIVFIASLSRTFHAKARYEIYESLTTPARYFGLRKEGSELEEFVHLLERIHYLISYDAVYAAINGINIFFMILRILKHMHFQPRMGVLTRTLVEAAPDIMNFFILWTIVFLGYAFMGHLVFGRSVDYFRSMGWSISSCFLLILGDTTSQYNLLELQGWEFAAGQFFFWTFNWFLVFIIMNFLIAIAVDAFVDVKEKTENAPTMPEELLEYARWEIHRIVKKRPSQKKLLRLLKVWRGRTPRPSKGGDHRAKSDVDTHDEETDVEERELVLKLDGKEIDNESLQSIFERRCDAQGVGGPAADPQAVAKRILVEYGEQVTKQRKEPRKPKKNADLLDIKAAVRNLESRMQDIGELLHGRLDAIHQDLTSSGLSKSLIPEEPEVEDAMDDGDEQSDGADSDVGGSNNNESP